MKANPSGVPVASVLVLRVQRTLRWKGERVKDLLRCWSCVCLRFAASSLFSLVFLLGSRAPLVFLVWGGRRSRWSPLGFLAALVAPASTTLGMCFVTCEKHAPLAARRPTSTRDLQAALRGKGAEPYSSLSANSHLREPPGKNKTYGQ